MCSDRPVSSFDPGCSGGTAPLDTDHSARWGECPHEPVGESQVPSFKAGSGFKLSMARPEVRCGLSPAPSSRRSGTPPASGTGRQRPRCPPTPFPKATRTSPPRSMRGMKGAFTSAPGTNHCRSSALRSRHGCSGWRRLQWSGRGRKRRWRSGGRSLVNPCRAC